MVTLRIRLWGLAALISLMAAMFNIQFAAAAGVLYVAPGGNCGGAAPCYSSPQAAVDAAQPGDEIRVAAGVYAGINTNGGHAQLLYVNKNLTLRGGFTTANWTSPDPAANAVELQAQTLGRVLYIEAGVNLTMDGFLLTYGSAAGLTPASGGGIYVKNGALTLSRSQVLHCVTPKNGAGGGLYARESVIHISNTRFEDNGSDNGGGAYLKLSTSTVLNSQFINNRVFSMNAVGQGISVEDGSVTFNGNTVDLNQTIAGSVNDGSVYFKQTTFSMQGNQVTNTTGGGGYGSGVSILYSSGVLNGNLIANHRNHGAAILGGYVTMTANEVSGNSGKSPQGGAGVAFEPPALNNPGRFTLVGNHIHHNTDNYGTAAGGGIHLSSSENCPVRVVNNTIQDNISAGGAVLSEDGNGGGAWIAGNNITLMGNLIQNNTANGWVSPVHTTLGGCGGGVYINGNATLINNIITGNRARFAGSGVYVIGASPNLYHNTIANNIFSASEDGSGVYASESSADVPGQPHLYNNIISHQAVGTYAYTGDMTSIIFIDGILWHANTQDSGGTIFINNPTSGDPLYVDTASGDYHILAGSAAIDHGIAVDVGYDMDQEPRLGSPDLGADEYWAPGVLQRVYLPMVLKP